MNVVRSLLKAASSVEFRQVQSSAWAILDLIKDSVSKVVSQEKDQIQQIKQKDVDTNVEKLTLHLACLPSELPDRELLMTTASFVGSFLLAGSSAISDSQFL